MKKIINFRGHGWIYCNAKSKIIFHKETDWKPFTRDEVMILLRLIRFGINVFNFTISSSTELDEEYEGIQLKTKVVDDDGYF